MIPFHPPQATVMLIAGMPTQIFQAHDDEIMKSDQEESTLRLFVGIPLPEKLKNTVSALVNETKHILPHFRWVKPANYHLTLRFLGEVPHNQVPHLNAELSRLIPRFSPMELSLNGTWGLFPSLRRGRILWLGIGGESVEILTVLSDSLASLPPPIMEHKPYKPHLTVARSHIVKPISRHQIAALPTIQERWSVAEIHMIQSILSNQGAQYRIIHSVPLTPPELHD